MDSDCDVHPTALVTVAAFCAPADGRCAPISCGNNQFDDQETDIDCGGPFCPPCAAEMGCETNEDCVDGFCDQIAKVCGIQPVADDMLTDCAGRRLTNRNCHSSQYGYVSCEQHLNDEVCMYVCMYR
jgi:hypothetical protein